MLLVQPVLKVISDYIVSDGQESILLSLTIFGRRIHDIAPIMVKSPKATPGYFGIRIADCGSL
jgi:hypothetical protein